MIDVLAVGALCGLPVQRVVDGDELERALWLRAVERAAALRVQLMRAQAAYTAEAVGKLFRRA